MDAGRDDRRTDEDLVLAAQKDPQGLAGRAAASELLGRYAERVYGFCRRYVRDPERAKDLGQDALLSAYAALPQFQRRSPFAGWMFAIARNRCLRELRGVAWMFDPEVDLERVEDPRPDAAIQLERAQDEDLVQRLADECLNDTERQALFLRCVERVPVDEITSLLGIDSASGARGVLQAARRKLRAELQKRGIEMGG